MELIILFLLKICTIRTINRIVLIYKYQLNKLLKISYLLYKISASILLSLNITSEPYLFCVSVIAFVRPCQNRGENVSRGEEENRELQFHRCRDKLIFTSLTSLVQSWGCSRGLTGTRKELRVSYILMHS